MSELFKALTDLEKRQESASTPFTPETKTADRLRPILRLTLPALLIVLFGIALLIFVQLNKKQIPDLNKQQLAALNQPPAAPAQEVNQQTAQLELVIDKATNETKQNLTDSALDNMVQEQKKQPFKISPGPNQYKKIIKAKVLTISPDYIKKEENYNEPASLNIPPTAAQLDIFEKRAATASLRQKRILQQAEILRKKGDFKGAVILYQKGLEIKTTMNPAIANNLASSLLLLGQTEQARKILEQALVYAPDDADLLYNFEIAGGKNIN